CRWNSAASPRRSSSTMPTWTQLSMPPSSVYSPLMASVAPLVPASWSSAASTTSSSSATQLRLSASRLAFLPIQPPKLVHWSTQNTTRRSPPTSRSASKKPSWPPVASALQNSQRATSCSQPCLSTWIHRHASSRKKSSVQSLPLPHSIPTKKHLSWQTTPSTAWLPTSG